ncbi:GNAT family N-acetyltransferase [Planomonospora sp. ID91781]|uniref:GNAT family N-acetyltransferase n=1 Tax=Planomonospora sp. ID91781 TaxID=2738135 RepID=UPI0018C4343E|nr:GNAT family N-acetyltransferase [Planomonospora sp. ID91781]MBG0823330.1 GNAT family N-acetyltransferase [Planomonospora sp. ID91781]
MSDGQVSVVIRPYRDVDRDAVVALASRLAEGVAAWRDASVVADAVHGWVTDSLEPSSSDGHGVLVAIGDGSVAGFVAVTTRRHFTGQVDASIGEFVVSTEVEGTGIGRALVNAAEAWARDRGLQRITLETGAANTRARGFYRALGYAEEEIRLSKPILIGDQSMPDRPLTGENMVNAS